MAASLPDSIEATREEWRDWAAVIEEKDVMSQLKAEYEIQCKIICFNRGTLWLQDKIHQASAYCMDMAIAEIKRRHQ